MKKVFTIIAVFLFHSLSNAQSPNENSIIKSEFKIIKLDSLDNVFIIYAKRKDSLYKIASRKETEYHCSPLIVGNSYYLVLESLLSPTANKRHIGGVKFYGTLVKTEGGNVKWDIFVTENISGLCYVKIDSEKKEATKTLNE